MSTQKQIEANRKNARKSTGPTSELGKKISARNSVRHGFYTLTVVLPTEDRDEFIRFARRVSHAYKPRDVLEEIQVKIIIETLWRMRRSDLVDSELFQIYSFYENEARGVGTAFANDATQGNAFSKLVRYQAFLTRKLNLAMKEIRKLAERQIIIWPGNLNEKPKEMLDVNSFAQPDSIQQAPDPKAHNL